MSKSRSAKYCPTNFWSVEKSTVPETFTLSNSTFPFTSKTACGWVSPIPIFPSEVIRILSLLFVSKVNVLVSIALTFVPVPNERSVADNLSSWLIW